MKRLIKMKNLGFITLMLIILGCTNNKRDKLYCGGKCPYNTICIVGKCSCPENKILFNSVCVPINDTNNIGQIINPIFLPLDSTKGCEFSKKALSWIFFDPAIYTTPYIGPLFSPTIWEGSFAYHEVGASNAEISTISSNLVSSTFLWSDGFIHTILKDHFTGTCSTPANSNTLLLDCRFNKKCDTVYLSYYMQCGSGERDTCYETRYLIK